MLLATKGLSRGCTVDDKGSRFRKTPTLTLAASSSNKSTHSTLLVHMKPKGSHRPCRERELSPRPSFLILGPFPELCSRQFRDLQSHEAHPLTSLVITWEKALRSTPSRASNAEAVLSVPFKTFSAA